MYGKDLRVKDIQEKLQKHYDNRRDVPQRNLHIHKNYDSYETVGSIFFSLDGSPPKGYGIYIPENRQLNLYDGHGRRWQILGNTDILDLDKFKDDDVLVAGTHSP